MTNTHGRSIAPVNNDVLLLDYSKQWVCEREQHRNTNTDQESGVD
jgi:hypothetical protein